MFCFVVIREYCFSLLCFGHLRLNDRTKVRCGRRRVVRNYDSGRDSEMRDFLDLATEGMENAEIRLTQRRKDAKGNADDADPGDEGGSSFRTTCWLADDFWERYKRATNSRAHIGV